MSRVEVAAAVKRYGRFLALDRVSLEIPSGAFFTLLGPSGCGKTTLLRALAGFHDLDSGELLLEGTSLRPLPPHQRNVGMVFQDYAVFPHLSVEDNVGFGLKRLRLPAAELERRLAEILQVVQLESLRQRMPHELSGGQQQRVGLARSLVMSPRVILMDEPLSNLDAQLREELRSEIRRIQQQLGITTVYVTHDQEEALAVSDLICVMHAGQVQQVGTPLHVYQNPTNLFVASFVGANNFIDAARLWEQPAVQSPSKNLSPQVDPTWIAALRPEQIQLVSERVAQCDFQWQGILREVNFLGREYHLRVETTTGLSLRVIQPVTEQSVPLRSGEPREIGFDWQHLKFFDSAAGGRRVRLDQ